jgi:hypothetical protein
MNAMIKEEQKDKEMEECTFKPKINEDYISSREGIENDTRKGRWDQLYKTGIQIISSRKDKPKDIIEVELYGKECTFRPQLFNEPVKDDGKIQNDIYNEKSYELLYSRLKNGRIQRILKESVHERGEFPNELNEIFSSPRKELNVTVKTQNSNSFNKPKKTKLKKDENNALNSNSHRANVNSSGNDSNQEEVVENFNNEPEKKDAIPLLIIDVNIRPGVKKKIYVFDGDTSEGLSEKFAKEHSKSNLIFRS